MASGSQRAPAGSGRARLLEAAGEGLVALDPNALTVQALCSRAGVGAPTLYHHFGSKDGLLGAAVDAQVEQWLTMLDLTVPRRGDLDETLDAAVAGWTAMILSPQRPLAVFVWATLLAAPASEHMREALQRARDHGEAMLTDGLRGMIADPVLAKGVARLAIAALIGAAVQYQLDADPDLLGLQLGSLAAVVRAAAGAMTA